MKRARHSRKKDGNAVDATTSGWITPAQQQIIRT